MFSALSFETCPLKKLSGASPCLSAKNNELGVRVAGLAAESLGDLDLEVSHIFLAMGLEFVNSNTPFDIQF